jgi:hypothetical protein
MVRYPNGDETCILCGMRYSPDEDYRAFQRRLHTLRNKRRKAGLPVYNLDGIDNPIPD